MNRCFFGLHRWRNVSATRVMTDNFPNIYLARECVACAKVRVQILAGVAEFPLTQPKGELRLFKAAIAQQRGEG